jgi:formyl-CoA transferase
MNRTKEELETFIKNQRKPETTKRFPLHGIRVLDISTIIAAPYASALLGDAGAEVIKVENPKAPDQLRTWGLNNDEGLSTHFSVLGRNKYPITIDLKSEEGKEKFFKLVRKSDVLIENMRTGVMDRIGLGYDKILESNPKIIIGKITGYGLTGPNASLPGYGTLAEAYSGFSYLNGYPDGGPTNPPVALADLTAGVHLACAITMALFDVKKNDSDGCIIDMSLYEPIFGYLGPEVLSYFLTGRIPQRTGNEFKDAAPRNSYKTKDGYWIALSCTGQAAWAKLATAMGREDLINHNDFKDNAKRTDPENRKRLNKIIQDWISTMTRDSALKLFKKEEITAGPINNISDINNDLHYNERKSITSLEDPLTRAQVKMPNTPFRFSGKQCKIRFPGLPTGAANDVIFNELNANEF